MYRLVKFCALITYKIITPFITVDCSGLLTMTIKMTLLTGPSDALQWCQTGPDRMYVQGRVRGMVSRSQRGHEKARPVQRESTD